MFAIYPGFEELRLRVEVEWKGRMRPVVARLEQWLDSKKTALVCQFEDDEDEGEWIIMGTGNGSPYTMQRPDRLKCKQTSFDTPPRTLSKTWKWKEAGIEKLFDIIRRAFDGEDFSVARLLKIPGLPAHRDLALCTVKGFQWVVGSSCNNWSAIPEQLLFNARYSQIQKQLGTQWQIAESEIRFAWEWAVLNDAQRKHQLGWPASWQAMEHIMSLVLIAASSSWQESDDIYWTFGANAQTGALEGECYDPYNPLENRAQLVMWAELLVRHFVPGWRADLIERYSCVSQYVKDNCYYGGNAELTSRPTAHEQIEAKLALRDWLADKATPAVADRLLASLDSELYLRPSQNCAQ